MEKLLFSEEQRFTQWWLWAIMIASLLAVLIPFANGIYSQVALNEPVGDNPMSTGGLVATGAFSSLLMAFIFFVILRSKLKTKITRESIYISFPPIINKWNKYVPEEIERFEVRIFRANREYGGYGMKRRRKYGQAYTVSGNIGLQLYFRNGKKLLVGTQKKQALEYALEKLMQVKK